MPTATDDIERTEGFLRAVREGTGHFNAAAEVGWTPFQLRQRMRDPDFAEMVQVAEAMLYEDMERTLNRLAKGGNMKALEMVLTNRRPERWRRSVEVVHRNELDVTITHSVKAGILQAISEGADVAALQPGGALGAIETTANDGPPATD